MNTKRLLITFASAFVLISCSDKEDLIGDWAPMEWEAEQLLYTYLDNGAYAISGKGDTVSFVCSNYDGIWFDGFTINKLPIVPEFENEGHTRMKCPWFSASLDGNKLTVIFATDTVSTRQMEITVTAGDIFYYFDFMQNAISPTQKNTDSDVSYDENEEEPTIGLWPLMLWQPEQTLVVENDTYVIPAEGGLVSFVCSNYNHAWFEGYYINGKYYRSDELYEDHMAIRGAFGYAYLVDNRLTISFAPNKDAERRIEIVDTAGDVFETFYFTQRGN